MLAARERRAALQHKLLQGGGCIVCLTMNIAGDVKRTPLIRLLFDRGMAELMALDPVKSLVLDDVTGPEGYLAFDAPAEEIKAGTEAIEESFPAARLFDMDVLTPAGKLSRRVGRSCLICGGPAAQCARSRAHGLEAVRAKTEELLEGFAADTLSGAAYMSLLDELYATPKPGLVDKNNSGAHSDMDVALFERSAEALRPFFASAAKTGMAGGSMAQLRQEGLKGEEMMFAATGGVNTHKGMVYSMGLLLAGMGRALKTGCDAVEAAAALAGEDSEAALCRSAALPTTNGGRVYARLGARGAVGEAAGGFKNALLARDRLRLYSELGCDAGPLALCDIMRSLEDTNLLHRGGREGLRLVRRRAGEISSLPVGERTAALYALDLELIQKNLSPGGGADMLALGYLLLRWERLSEALFDI